MSKEELFWSVESSETISIHSRETDKGILLILDTKVECFEIDENGSIAIHLKRKTAADISNILNRTLVEGNPKED